MAFKWYNNYWFSSFFLKDMPSFCITIKKDTSTHLTFNSPNNICFCLCVVYHKYFRLFFCCSHSSSMNIFPFFFCYHSSTTNILHSVFCIYYYHFIICDSINIRIPKKFLTLSIILLPKHSNLFPSRCKSISLTI